MASYEFVTVWRLRAPQERVWDAIYDADRWPEWWRGVEKVEAVAAGDGGGRGAVRRFTWKSRLPYRLVLEMTSTLVEAPRRLEGIARGELEGRGIWTLGEDAGVTTVRYDWRVATTRAWMNLLAPIARPAFAWNHDVVMRWGGEGLARRLRAELL